MTFEQFLGAGISVVSVLMLGHFLNYRGQLLWRSQVDKEIAAIVKGYEDVIGLYKKQCEDARVNTDAWKDVARGNMPVMSKAVEGVVEAVKKAGP